MYGTLIYTIEDQSWMDQLSQLEAEKLFGLELEIETCVLFTVEHAADGPTDLGIDWLGAQVFGLESLPERVRRDAERHAEDWAKENLEPLYEAWVREREDLGIRTRFS